MIWCLLFGHRFFHKWRDPEVTYIEMDYCTRCGKSLKQSTENGESHE